jgi:flagellar operon protein
MVDGVNPTVTQGVQPSVSRPAARPGETAGAGFQAALDQARSPVSFSRHAAKRIEERGLELDPARLARLEAAVGRAAEKGSRDSLILLDELALVVSVQHRTVVTAMDEATSKEHVFTNIDSVVIADRSP